MLFMLGGMFCLFNLQYGWFPIQFGITADGELIGALVMALIGVVQIQTDKILTILKGEEDE